MIFKHAARIIYLGSALLLAATVTTASPPHIVFIMADDCTHWDLGCYGGQAHTPNIDRLATEGMRFTQCFQAAPMCSPTRHNIYTGLYPVKSGAYPNHTHANPGTKSIVHYLKPLGYRVHLSGKTHIGSKEVFPFEYSANQGNPAMSACDKLMAESVAAKTPFCLFAMSNEPHSPWNKGDPSRYKADELKLPDNWVDTPETRRNMVNYLAEITYYDDQVGQLLALLDKHKIADDTLVVVVSEQGSSFPFAKWTCYDAGLQSAMIVRWPGKVEAGTVSDALVEYIDVAPTFVEAGGGTPAKALQGRSMVELLCGRTREHKNYVFGEMTTRGIIKGSDYYGIRSIRSKQYKLIWNFTPEVQFRNACSQGSIFKSWMVKAETDPGAARLVKNYQQRPGWELYDVTKDTFEQNNLADHPAFAQVKAGLEKELKAWMEACGDKGQQTELEAKEHQGGGR